MIQGIGIGLARIKVLQELILDLLGIIPAPLGLIQVLLGIILALLGLIQVLLGVILALTGPIQVLLGIMLIITIDLVRQIPGMILDKSSLLIKDLNKTKKAIRIIIRDRVLNVALRNINHLILDRVEYNSVFQQMKTYNFSYPNVKKLIIGLKHEP